jgi:hypothetical protein
MDAGGVSPRSTSPGYAESSSMRRSRTPTTSPRLRLTRGWTCLRLRLAPARPIGVLFLLQRSCLASALTRRPVNARWLWVFARRWSLGAGPPFPASCAFADAAIPRTVVAAIPRGSAGGGRHPPDCVDGHRRRGVKRTASIATEMPNQGRRGPQPPPPTITTPLPADGRAGAIGEVRRPVVCLGQALRATAQRASQRWR